MNAATYTAITAASDTSPSHLSNGAALLICLVCFGLVATIILIAILDGK